MLSCIVSKTVLKITGIARIKGYSKNFPYLLKRFICSFIKEAVLLAFMFPQPFLTAVPFEFFCCK